MYINKKSSRRPATKRIRANEEIMEEVGGVEVDAEATDLLFEAEDVAELVAEVTGEDVEVAVDSDAVVFTVGEEEFTVEPEGNEEILETSRKVLRGKRAVKASRAARPRAARPARRRR